MANNTDYSRGLLAYTDRDYQTLYENFTKLVPTLTDLWTPEADADPGVVIGKYIASVADMLGVNIDWLADNIIGEIPETEGLTETALPVVSQQGVKKKG